MSLLKKTYSVLATCKRYKVSKFALQCAIIRYYPEWDIKSMTFHACVLHEVIAKAVWLDKKRKLNKHFVVTRDRREDNKIFSTEYMDLSEIQDLEDSINAVRGKLKIEIDDDNPMQLRWYFLNYTDIVYNNLFSSASANVILDNYDRNEIIKEKKEKKKLKLNPLTTCV